MTSLYQAPQARMEAVVLSISLAMVTARRASIRSERQANVRAAPEVSVIV